MPNALIREYHDDDLEDVVRLWEQVGTSQGSSFTMGECIAALRADEPAVVAVSSGHVVAAAVSTVSGERAWVMRLAVDADHRGKRLASGCLIELERLLVEQGVRRISYVLPDEDGLVKALVNAGYERRPAVGLYEKVESLGPGESGVLQRLGGRLLPPDLWDRLGGMEVEKSILERTVVLPLSQPERAAAHGVTPPRALVLFGPPGTGKTSFARGIASRLGWPFVEIFPSRLATDAGGLAGALRDTFASLAELERVIVFIDEVEEIAPQRELGSAPGGAHGVTNELLKLIPTFRERDTRLLVCATNSVRSLDSAFLRPGRFDLLIPVGPPDPAARQAIWSVHVGRSGREDVDLDSLVAASDTFTPADIEYAARRAAQAAFERDVVDGRETPVAGASTDDYLVAIRGVRPTVTAEMVAMFREDIARYARG